MSLFEFVRKALGLTTDEQVRRARKKHTDRVKTADSKRRACQSDAVAERHEVLAHGSTILKPGGP